MSDTFDYVDLIEHLIHVNNPTNLIFTVNGRLNFSNLANHEKKRVLDIKFYEACTITVFAKFAIEDNQFRANYVFLMREAHRGTKHSIFILISQVPNQHVMSILYRFEYRLPLRLFVVDLKPYLNSSNLPYTLEMEWLFFCIFCKDEFIPISYNVNIKVMTLRMFQVHQWRNDVSIAAILPQKFKPNRICGKGQYYITSLRENCNIDEMKYLAVGDILNITFLQFPDSDWAMYNWGYFHQDLMHSEYFYKDLNMLYSFRYEGHHAIYCNFNVWSENSNLGMWMSPFTSLVWTSCALILVTLVILRVLKDVVECGNIAVNFELIKNLGEVVFAIFATFIKQALNSKHLSKLVLVPLLFTSFMLLSQYELFLTTNLVIPPRYEKYLTLRKVFANDYILVYAAQSQEGNDLLSITSLLQQEYKQKSLGNFPHDKTIPIRYE